MAVEQQVFSLGSSRQSSSFELMDYKFVVTDEVLTVATQPFSIVVNTDYLDDRAVEKSEPQICISVRVDREGKRNKLQLQCNAVQCSAVQFIVAVA